LDGIGLKDEAGPAAKREKAQVADLIREIGRRLENVYGRPEIPQGNPLSILIRTILSQNTSDVNRDRAYTELWNAFRSYDEILESPITSLEAAIRSGGLARQKAIAIKNALLWVKERYGNYDLSPICEEAPERAEKLLTSIKGVGIKTARVTLLFGCGMALFPVDTHIARVLRRLGVVPASWSREKIHRFLDGKVEPGVEAPLHLNIIRLGRNVCLARKPRCEECPLHDICEFARRKTKGENSE